MFIAIVGTRFSGKSTVEDYLVTYKNFTPVRLIQAYDGESVLDGNITINPSSRSYSSSYTLKTNGNVRNKHDSFLSMSPLPSPAPTAILHANSRQPLCFSSPKDLLDFVTSRWRDDFVTCDLDTKGLVDLFIRRPFFLLLSVEAPMLDRFHRAQSLQDISLDAFIQEDDRLVFGTGSTYSRKASLHDLRDSIHVHVRNTHDTIGKLYAHLEDSDLLNSEHLRPSWDSYFMTLASLASRRSNCMKRRVGAVLVRQNRVIATGYNGTPRGLQNCNEGGCQKCNGVGSHLMAAPTECVCLHAEENALLEAGRERIGANAVLYCNTCPCLKCTVKIIQTGVKTVVYNLAYKMDNASASLFKESGVELRHYDPHTSFRLPPANDESNIASP